MTARFGDPSLALILLGTSLVFALAAAWDLIREYEQRIAALERSALDEVERRSRRVRVRLDQFLRRGAVGSAIGVRLHAAGVPVTVVDAIAIAVGVAALGYLLGRTLFPWWLSVLVALGCLRACLAWVDHKRLQRRQRFVAQLPDVARILSNASSAGLSVRTAIEMAAEELDDPARSEFALVAEELRLGRSLEDALRNLESRMPSRDVAVLISTLAIQQRTGGDLVRALQEMALTLEARRDLQREVRTVMAGSVYTGYLVGAMGIGALFLINLITPDAIEKMTSVTGGRIALLVAGALYAIGFTLVKRVTRIEL
jgi:tight adherence protein B